MDSGRPELIQELFHSARRLAPEDRIGFLSAQAVDPSVLAEVLSLLEHHDSSFLKDPAVRGARDAMEAAKRATEPGPEAYSSQKQADAVEPDMVGLTVGHYRIVAKLGAGGMGVVYRATDLTLGRDVALKFLRGTVGESQNVLERFQREARMAAAVNHPNICTLHELSEYEGRRFIAMELLKGETLKERIGGRPVSLESLLTWTIQLLAGLQAAHDRGILHRDLKPANLFITRQNQAKILDFGLSKPFRPMVNSSDLTETGAGGDLTAPGSAPGTPGYMSPEQIRGEALDARSDLFSFGAVLYEMSTGCMPFRGKTLAAVAGAILHETPPPPSSINSEIPLRLEETIRRVMEKSPGMRHQTASELSAELISLQSETAGRLVAAPTRLAAGLTAKPAAQSRFFSILSAHRAKVAAAFALIAVSCGLWWFLPSRHDSTVPELTQQRLTFNSSENQISSPALSSDGKYLAYQDGKGVHVKLLSTGEESLIIKPAVLSSDDWNIVCWYPDGTHLLVGSHQTPRGYHKIWSLSVLGQSVRSLREAGVGFGVSPDGKKIAFSPVTEGKEFREIWVMDVDGANAKKVYDIGDGKRLNSVRWSPNGTRLAYCFQQFRTPRSWYSIETIDLNGHGISEVIHLAGLMITGFQWLADGRLVYLRDAAFRSPDTDLWALGIDNLTGIKKSDPKRLTQWAEADIWGLSATADGKSLALLRTASRPHIYLADLTDAGTRLKNLRVLSYDETTHTFQTWTHDSKAFFLISNRTGRNQIFKQFIQRDAPEPITTSSQDVTRVRLSPDGAWILYEEAVPSTSLDRNPRYRIMRIPLDGGIPQLVFEETDLPVSFWCSAAPATTCATLEADIEGPKQVNLNLWTFDPVSGQRKFRRTIHTTTEYRFYGISLSLDGSTLAINDESNPQSQISLLSLTGGVDRRVVVRGFEGISSISWAASGKGFYCGNYSQTGNQVLYIDLLGAATILWKNMTGSVLSVSGKPSPDGRHIALSGSVTDSNVWRVEGF